MADQRDPGRHAMTMAGHVFIVDCTGGGSGYQPGRTMW